MFFAGLKKTLFSNKVTFLKLSKAFEIMVQLNQSKMELVFLCILKDRGYIIVLNGKIPFSVNTTLKVHQESTTLGLLSTWIYINYLF